jgi:very-short-patch-repair endonuclease
MALREDPSPLSRLRERARVRAPSLRKDQTDAEALLWSKLRNRQLLGLKFRRQHPSGNYFADFACIEIGLIVELDGGQHGEDKNAGYDERRTGELRAMGFQVLRFWNNDVLNETTAVLEKIYQTAETLTPTLSRKRERERSGAERDHRPTLTPTLSRKRERGQDKEPT